RPGVLRRRRARRRRATDLRAVADLDAPTRDRRCARRAPSLWPDLGPAVRRDICERRLLGDQLMATPPADWKLPDLRIDRDGDWYDEGVQVTHPGILANLRSNLKKDAEGYFIQTRVRIPVNVDDAP